MKSNLLACTLVPLLSVSLVAQSSLAYAAAPMPAQAGAPASDHALHDGTPVKLRLAQTISSGTAKTGQEVPFEVVEDLQVDGVTVLAKGAIAIGVVTEAQSKRNMGRAGKLDMSISYARLRDNEKVALRAVQESKGGSHTGAMTGAMVATSLIIWPAAPFFLFMKGKDVAIPQGTEITSFIDGDMHLDMAKFGVGGDPNAAGAAGAPAGQASMTIESTPAGADIEVDGSFVGSTPSTVSVAAGTHEIAVRKKGFAAWTRRMAISGSSVHLSAELERQK